MTGVDSEPVSAGSPGDERRRRIRALWPTVVFDIAGPLAVYYGLKGAGLSNVTALIISGIPPALRVLGSVLRHRRVDAIGVLVLAGIVAGTIVGLVSHSARLLLLEGVVPTAVFGLVCLASLATSRPMMYRFAITFIGADTPKGREFEGMWRYEGFRNAFRVVTVVWALAYLVEAAVKAVIVLTMSISSAKAVSQVLPYAVLGLVAAWNVRYGKRRRAEGERMRAGAGAAAEPVPDLAGG